MKKLIAIIALAATTITAQAQSFRAGTFSAVTAAGTVKALDTTTNTDTTYLWDGRADHNQWGCSFQFINTQITGTTTMTVLVQGSNDATSAVTGNWYSLINDKTQAIGSVDSLTTKNVYSTFNLPACQYKYIRIRNITGGTQTSVMTGKWWLYSKYSAPLN